MKKLLTILCLVLLSSYSYSEDIPYETFYDNGQLQEKGNYKEGKIHGLSESFYPTGIIRSKGNFISGLRDGLWGFYSPNGQLKEMGNFKNGELIE